MYMKVAGGEETISISNSRHTHTDIAHIAHNTHKTENICIWMEKLSTCLPSSYYRFFFKRKTTV